MEKLYNGGIYTEVDVDDMNVNDDEDDVDVVSSVEEDVVDVVSNVKVALEEDMKDRDNSGESAIKGGDSGPTTYLSY